MRKEGRVTLYFFRQRRMRIQLGDGGNNPSKESKDSVYVFFRWYAFANSNQSTDATPAPAAMSI